MFVAWRDLRFAKGRFALMGTVVGLITLLVGLLSGLTAGLGRASTSAIADLPADHIAFTATGKAPSFTDSTVDAAQWQGWSGVDGVRDAEPLGISTVRAATAGHTSALAAFGVRPGSRLAPSAASIGAGSVVLSTKAATDLDVRAGSDVTVNGQRLTVAAVAGDASYSHTSVAWTSLADWQRLSPGTDSGEHATVIALTTSSTGGLAAADDRLHTRTVSRSDALSAIGSYTSENGSLQLMRGFLFAISALVIGAFFTVWTIQRAGDVAVLKALGASTGYLLRDALGQAVVLLLLGTGLGGALAAALGFAATGSAVPFVLDVTTTVLPAAALVLLGAAGAALAIRRITAVDPLTALGSAR